MAYEPVVFDVANAPTEFCVMIIFWFRKDFCFT
jgi:hypothetical protein